MKPLGDESVQTLVSVSSFFSQAAADTALLWVLVACTMSAFHQVSPAAAYLLLPYQVRT